MSNERSGALSSDSEAPDADLARAKVNLTLQIKGKRADGYHEIESLVLFADFGDAISFAPSDTFSLTIDGPFAAALDQSGNLVEDAAKAYAAAIGGCPQGAFRLTKSLPVAAGVGGGSADAAAALRIMMRHDQAFEDLSALVPLAGKLGADVPCCLFSQAMIMTGIGEKLHHLPPIAPIPAVLVNPLQPLPTGPVFRALGAGSLAGEAPPFERPDLSSLSGVVDYANARSNDLETPARGLLPVIDEIFSALRRSPGALLTRLSGSGPTCFALFATMAEAESAASALGAERPDWWVRPVRLS